LIGIDLKEYRIRSLRFVTRLALSVGLLSMVACSYSAPKYENRAEVTGTVTYQGKLLLGGSVTMASKDNPSMMGVSPIREDGTFAFGDAPLGAVVISVSTDAVKVGNPSKYTEIPAKYGDAATSGLTAEIKADGNGPLDLKLE
jgi:hypothetical protein